LSDTRRRSIASDPSPAASTTASVTRISPVDASEAMCAATLTASPNAVNSLDVPLDTMPTNAIPVFTPAPSGSHGPSRSPWPTAARSSRAARTAAPAWSGPVMNGMKNPTTSSPTNLSRIAPFAINTSFAVE
jgi:hypothetical protein